MPVELQRPVEATNIREVGLNLTQERLFHLGVVILEGVVVDHVDHWADNSGLVALDSVQ